jgi:hypothetical protein
VCWSSSFYSLSHVILVKIHLTVYEWVYFFLCSIPSTFKLVPYSFDKCSFVVSLFLFFLFVFIILFDILYNFIYSSIREFHRENFIDAYTVYSEQIHHFHFFPMVSFPPAPFSIFKQYLVDSLCYLLTYACNILQPSSPPSTLSYPLPLSHWFHPSYFHFSIQNLSLLFLLLLLYLYEVAFVFVERHLGGFHVSAIVNNAI